MNGNQHESFFSRVLLEKPVDVVDREFQDLRAPALDAVIECLVLKPAVEIKSAP